MTAPRRTWGRVPVAWALPSVLLGALALAGAALLWSQTEREAAVALYEQRRFADAAQAFESYLEKKPDDTAARLLLGLSRQLVGDTRSAEAEFRKVASARPGDSRARFFLARAQYLNGRLNEARQSALEALRLGEPAERTHNLIGLVLEEQHEYGKALEAYQRAMRSERQFAEAHFNAGKLLIRMNRPAEALTFLQKAVELEPSAPDSFYHLARAQLALGDTPAAKRSLEKAVSLPGETPARSLLERLRSGIEPQAATADPVYEKPAAIRFRDAAAQWNLPFVLNHNPTPEKHLIETMTGGVAAFDYDNDGFTDLYFVNGATVPSLSKDSPKYYNRLYRNNGGKGFTDVTNEAGVAGVGYSMGVAAADYDNDGHADLFVAGFKSNTLFRNRGDGTFEDVTKAAGIRSESWSVAAVWLDYDRDGFLDLFVVNYLDWSPSLDIFCGDRKTGFRVYCHPKHYSGLPNTLYRNRGDGTFEDVSAASGIAAHIGKGMSAATADYDGDGYPSLFVTNDTLPNFLFRNRGDGTFEEVALPAGVALTDDGKAVSSMGVDFRDYDNDGLPDISVTALEGETFPLFRNLGNGYFVDATFPSHVGRFSVRRSGWSNGFLDFNNNGWKDLFSANAHVTDNIEEFSEHRYRQPNSVFANLGNGIFADVSEEGGPDFQVAGAHRGAAFADFNNDGRIDVAVSRLGEPAQLWINESPGNHRWIILKLQGTKSNRDGIGAEIRIGAQHNHMTTSVGYASSSHFGVHFGLGSLDVIPRIEIRWPSGVLQVLEEVRTNQILRVMEAAE